MSEIFSAFLSNYVEKTDKVCYNIIMNKFHLITVCQDGDFLGKYIKNYVAAVDKMLNDDNTDFEKLRIDFLLKIEFFQHERQVHFLVTFMVIMALFISILYILITGLQIMAVLSVILLGLTAAYLAYYYFIENTVMQMYKTYDKIAEKIEQKKNNETSEIL